MERDLELGPLLELGNKIREKKHEATFICQSCRWIGGATEDPWLFFAIMWVRDFYLVAYQHFPSKGKARE